MNKNYIIEGDNGNRNSDFNKFHSLSFLRPNTYPENHKRVWELSSIWGCQGFPGLNN